MIIAKHFLPRNKFLRLHSLSQQKEPKQDFETYFIIWILLLWESELSIDCVSFVIVRLSVSQARFIRPEKRQPGYYHRESELLDVFLLFHNVSQSRYIKISTQGGTIEGREKHINRYNVFFFILIALFPGGTHQLFDRQGVGMGMTTGQPAKQDQTREVLQQQQQQKHIHLSRRNAGRKNTHNNSTTSYLDRVTKSLLCRSWRNQEGTHTTQPID